MEISQEKFHSPEQQMDATIEETNSLSQEVAKSKGSIEALKRTLSMQRSPLNKSGLGYNQELANKPCPSLPRNNGENVRCWDDAFIYTPMQQKNDKKINPSY